MNTHTKWPRIDEVVPAIRLQDIPAGTRILGLAPIGIRWEGKMGRNGKIKPAGNCPRGEFAAMYACLPDGVRSII